MTEHDIGYIKLLLKSDVIAGPVLELGAGYGGNTCQDLIEDAGLIYEPTDMFPSGGVKYVANFTDRKNIATIFGTMRYGTVLVLNVLEHTFDPVSILDNALTLVDVGGKLVIITPAVWTLHNYPIDCNRLLPNFYEEYAKTRDCALLYDYFCYVGFGKVRDYVDHAGNYQFPPPVPKRSMNELWSRSIHKLLNTFGRGMVFPCHIAVGVTIQKAGKT